MWYADAHLHLPNRVAKHLRHSGCSFWNLVPEHRSNSITFSMKMSLKTHIRRSTEQRRKEMEKVNRRIASYRPAHNTWSTKACAKYLPHTWLWTEAGRNERRLTHRAPMTQALPHVLQSFAKAFANAFGCVPVPESNRDLPPGSYQAGGRRRGSHHGWAIENLPVRKFLYSTDLRNNRWLLELSTVILSISPNFAQRNPRIGYL